MKLVSISLLIVFLFTGWIQPLTAADRPGLDDLVADNGGQNPAFAMLVKEVRWLAEEGQDPEARELLQMARTAPLKFISLVKTGLKEDKRWATMLTLRNPWLVSLLSGDNGLAVLLSADGLDPKNSADMAKLSLAFTNVMSSVAAQDYEKRVKKLSVDLINDAVEGNRGDSFKELGNLRRGAQTLNTLCDISGSALNLLALRDDLLNQYQDPSLQNALKAARTEIDLFASIAELAQNNKAVMSALKKSCPTLSRHIGRDAGFFKQLKIAGKGMNLFKGLGIAISLIDQKKLGDEFVEASDEYFDSVESVYAQPLKQFGTVEGLMDDLAKFGRINKARQNQTAAARKMITSAVAKGVAGTITVLSGGTAAILADVGQNVATSLSGLKGSERKSTMKHNKFVLDHFDEWEMGSENFGQFIAGYKNNMPKLDRIRDVVSSSITAADVDSLLRLHGMLKERIADPSYKDAVIKSKAFVPQIMDHLTMGLQVLENAMNNEYQRVRSEAGAEQNEKNRQKLWARMRGVQEELCKLQVLMIREKIGVVRK